jgi:hypothetical protein
MFRASSFLTALLPSPPLLSPAAAAPEAEPDSDQPQARPTADERDGPMRLWLPARRPRGLARLMEAVTTAIDQRVAVQLQHQP